MPTPSSTCDVGLIGLGVMGQNLALNMADHGYRVAVYNRTSSATDEFVAERRGEIDATGGGDIVATGSLKELLSALPAPRIIVLLIKAGPAIDAVCRQLLEAGLGAGDVVVDGGNSLWTDTIRREKEYRGRLTFFGSGVSGGETGARFGPSLMPGGDPAAWRRLRPIWEAIAAKVDPATGKPTDAADGEPCTAHLGPDGAGHYVKMVHNGIEYADMQLICEAYHLLRHGLGLEPASLGDIFAEWDTGELDSYLIEITADILRQTDPGTGRPLVDVILDRAGQKGTGGWTAVNAVEMGIPAASIAEAVFARSLSALKDERVVAARTLTGPSPRAASHLTDDFIGEVRDALLCSKMAAYAQGFQLMRAAQNEYGWKLDFADIARIWRGGCIIRARMLQPITEAFTRTPDLPNLLLDEHFRDRIDALQAGWRTVVAAAATMGVPAPAFASSLAYYDGYRTETLPAQLLQAQRDYFGAHTYERVDRPRGKRFHTDWPDPARPEVEVG